MLRKLRRPHDMDVSLTVGPKGSYRLSHVAKFLERWLLPWSPERDRLNDYKIVYLDAFRAHLDESLQELCWSRGYVLLYHYGGTTGVCQVNDTDCHASFSREYIDLECHDFMDKQLMDPADISRTNQDVVDDAAQTWLHLDHTEGVRGHKRTGLSIRLDGTEDAWMTESTREAGVFWTELDMPTLRREAIAAVTARFEASESPSFSSWRELVEHPERGLGFGEHGEGFEFEAPLEDGEASFEDAGEKAEADADELRAMQAMLDDSLEAIEDAARAQPEDDPEDSSGLRRPLRASLSVDPHSGQKRRSTEVRG